ncbi:hypothetical protein C7974DRAFT_312649 [Boeremia exigua]|uniref:uncharacterized protein n=1 Tax=Boeremia exigua TaxID=749465 RepID=UPI001E8DC0B3|nr:uncharacterized protein C7974DRAFT_312649 [Boeremia exigua]KAH6625917.1 hypothetical protein C7974DRAFT_312649 [Boeremia exigua]
MADKLEAPFTPRPLPTTSAATSPTSSQQLNHVVLDTPTLSTLDSLPTLAGRGATAFLANDDIPAFLAQDLDLSRLNAIHAHLWMAGRPMRARPLHRYKMYAYEPLATTQMDLHLLRFSNKILLKPLPDYLLDAAFWRTHLTSPPLWEAAAGLLLSYTWLLTTPLDLALAHAHALVPAALTWAWWKPFASEVLRRLGLAAHAVNPRFAFGDLRLARVNSIYRTRFFATHFVRGYLYGYNRYALFFERNVAWLLVVFVFLGLVLSAMQVGTALDELNSSRVFLRGAFGVVVLCMVCVVAVLGGVGVVFAGVFFWNMVAAVRHAGREERERRRARKRGGAKEV